MCHVDSRPLRCRKPNELRGNASDCSKEQVAECHGASERHPCICHFREDSVVRGLSAISLLTVVCAPVVFWIYWKNDLVCAPRAITASAIFGIVPLLFLMIGILKEKRVFFSLTLWVLVVEMLITPIIMLRRLGWEKFAGERLLAFFTFEGIAIVQIVIVLLVFKTFRNLNKDGTQTGHSASAR